MEEIKTGYDLCIKEPHEYKRKVNSISDLLLLKGNKRLIDTDCPVFVVGNYEMDPIVMFGINPGYSSKNNPSEDREARILGKIIFNFIKIFITILKVIISNPNIIRHSDI